MAGVFLICPDMRHGLLTHVRRKLPTTLAHCSSPIHWLTLYLHRVIIDSAHFAWYSHSRVERYTSSKRVPRSSSTSGCKHATTGQRGKARNRSPAVSLTWNTVGTVSATCCSPGEPRQTTNPFVYVTLRIPLASVAHVATTVDSAGKTSQRPCASAHHGQTVQISPNGNPHSRHLLQARMTRRHN